MRTVGEFLQDRKGPIQSIQPDHTVREANVISVSPKQTIEECIELMTHHHIRHLPVLQDHELFGLISIGDVVREILAAQLGCHELA